MRKFGAGFTIVIVFFLLVFFARGFGVSAKRLTVMAQLGMYITICLLPMSRA